MPTDLHIFTDLNVANDLVEDVFSVFQEIEQKAGSDKETPDKVTGDRAMPRKTNCLRKWARLRSGSTPWRCGSTDKPDDLKVTTEAHDKAEMPESGIALGGLAAAAQDLIGDLLKEDKKMADKADDSATNHAMPDSRRGPDVMEGDIASFGAQGKSGNQTPNHKEQDGRSNVGRQGMSTGETAASSGTIGEGDKNIEARRTRGAHAKRQDRSCREKPIPRRPAAASSARARPMHMGWAAAPSAWTRRKPARRKAWPR